MKSKTRKAQIARCQRYFDEWLRIMGLLWYECSITFCTSEDGFQRPDNGIAVMRTWVRWQYMKFDIDVNLPAVKRLSDDDLERCIVHELCHVLVNEMRNGADFDINHEERVVTQLTKAFLWTRKLQREESE